MTRLHARWLPVALGTALLSSFTLHTRNDGSRPSDFPLNAYENLDTIKTSLDDYDWPTNASHSVTSTFGEFRPSHFHGGIDISTNNTSGYKVFAARDGYVWRISVLPSGYGKMLYVRHADGYTTTYSHLKTFNDTINSIVRREQLRLERYPVEITLGPTELPVHKGDLIAYSGRSGTRVPHLHFEIRDENLNPLNPFLFGRIAVPDDLPPSIPNLAVLPLDENSTVWRKRSPLITRNFVRRKTSYELRQEIPVSGTIGLAVNARDRLSGTYHRVGIHRLELYLDDSLTFAAQLDRLPANDSKQILLFYNLPLLKKRLGRFQQLYVAEGTTLPIYERRRWGAGVIETDGLPEGEHTFRIIAKDIRGNATELSGKLRFSPAPDERLRLKPQSTNGVEPSAHDSSDIHIPEDSSGWFSFDRDSLQVWYDSAAVFTPLTVHVDKGYERGKPIYRLNPQDVLLNGGFRVFIRASGIGEKSAVYVRENRHWELKPTTFDSSTGYFSAYLTRTLGDVTILEDNVPPSVGSLRIGVKRKRPSITFRISDGRSGIDANEIKMYIDGEFAIPEVDGERRRVSYETDGPLQRGRHTLTIMMKDMMNNETTLTRTFFVN